MKYCCRLFVLILLLAVIGCAGSLSGLRSDNPAVKVETITQLTAKEAQDLNVRRVLFTSLSDENESVRKAAARKIQQLGLVDELSPDNRLRLHIVLGQWDALADQCSRRTAEVLLEAYRQAGPADKSAIKKVLVDLECDEAHEAIGAFLAKGLAKADWAQRQQAYTDTREFAYGDKLPTDSVPYFQGAVGNYSGLAGPGNCDSKPLLFLQKVIQHESTPLEHKRSALMALAGSQCASATEHVLSALEKWPVGEPLPADFATAFATTDMVVAQYFTGVEDPRQGLAALKEYRQMLKEISTLSEKLARQVEKGYPPDRSTMVTACRLAFLQVRTGQLPEAMASLATAEAVAGNAGGRMLVNSLSSLTEALSNGSLGAMNRALNEAKKKQQEGRIYLQVEFTDTIKTMGEYQLQGAIKTSAARLLLGSDKKRDEDELAAAFMQNLRSSFREVRAPETMDNCIEIIGLCLTDEDDKRFVLSGAMRNLGYLNRPSSYALIVQQVTEDFHPHAYQSLSLLDTGDWQRTWNLLESQNEYERFAAVFALGYHAEDADTKARLKAKLAGEPSARVKLGLHFALAQQGDDASFQALVAAIRADNLLALQLMQWLPVDYEKRVPRKLLVKQLSNTDETHQAFAAAILADGKHRLGQSTLRELADMAVTSDSKNVREQSAKALAANCQAARPIMREQVPKLAARAASGKDVESGGLLSFYQDCECTAEDEAVLLHTAKKLSREFSSELHDLRYGGYGDQKKAEQLLSAAAGMTMMLGRTPSEKSRFYLTGKIGDEFLGDAALRALMIQGIKEPQAVIAILAEESDTIEILNVRATLGDQEALTQLIDKSFHGSALSFYITTMQVTGNRELADKLVEALGRETDPIRIADMTDGLIRLAMAHPEMFQVNP